MEVMDATISSSEEIGLDARERPYVVDYGDFEALYRREYPALHALATALVGFDDGEDLVHDTMYRTLVHWRRVRSLERPGGWCHRVLVNICRSFWRRKKVRDRYAGQLAWHRNESGPSPDILAFWDVVRTMPTRPRMIVALYFAGDRTTADIASILDVPEGTVRSDLTRAKAVLARALKN